MAVTPLHAPDVDALIRLHTTDFPDLTLPFSDRAGALVALMRGLSPSDRHDGARFFWTSACRDTNMASEWHEPWCADDDTGDGHTDGGRTDDGYANDGYIDDDHVDAGYVDSGRMDDDHSAATRDDPYRRHSQAHWYLVEYAPSGRDHLFTINGRFTLRIAEGTAPAPDGVTLGTAAEFPAHGDDSPGEAAGEALLDWLVDGAERCIRQCAQGEYNAMVAEQLPYAMRTGMIARHALWRIFPHSHEYLRSIISDGDIDRFEAVFGPHGKRGERGGQGGHGEQGPAATLPQLTFAQYCEICRVAYDALGLRQPHPDATALDWYREYANPRGMDVHAIDADDAEAFARWVEAGLGTDHEWEIRSASGFSWMTLHPVPAEPGWTLVLRCGNYPSDVETVRVALALHDAGIPVEVSQADQLVRAMRGQDMVGIVPQYLMDYDPEALFGGNVIVAMHLPHEHRQAIIDEASWQPIEPVRLTTPG